MTERERQYNYIRRNGRATRGQARSLKEHAAAYTVQRIVHNPPRPLGVEIGFGMGHALIEWARVCPDWDLVGIELYRPGIGALLGGLAHFDIENVKYVEQPAQVALETVTPQTIDEVRIYFPDPWPKKRHAKRRLIQPEFVALLARVIRGGGTLHLATDWSPYAEWMRECLAANADFVAGDDEILRPATKFEHRGRCLGYEICDIKYRRIAMDG